MPNFTAKILGNATSSLAAQQALIATTATNISNVNTPGYAKRTLELQTRMTEGRLGVEINVGSGVDLGAITRLADKYLTDQMFAATSEKNSTQVQNDFLGRIQGLFSLREDSNTISTALTAFFSAVNDLTADPSSIELRSNVIERGRDLCDSIRNTYQGLADLQTEADLRLGAEVQTVNSLAAQIATLNTEVAKKEVTGNVAADERDRREKLLQQLAEKVSYSMVESADGQVTVTLANGFALVYGSNYRELKVQTPSSGSEPPSLDGGVLSSIVYNYDSSGSSTLDLTQTLSAGTGTIGGLLAIRGYNDSANTSAFDGDGILVEIASRVEAISRNLLTAVNESYLGPDRDAGTAGHQASSGDLSGNAPDVYGLFNFEFSGTPADMDTDGNGLPDDLSDPALGIDNFSSIIQMAFSDPTRLAAALDAGSGAPAAAVFAPGDGRNLQVLAALASESMSFTMGSFSLTGTFDQVYNETVGAVGNYKTRAELNANVAEDKLVTAETKRDEVSGVSLDEEFTNLIKFQRAYQASARLIKIADDLLQQIVNLL
jgi:flagellar hook-associated protein 1 FlgK